MCYRRLQKYTFRFSNFASIHCVSSKYSLIHSVKSKLFRRYKNRQMKSYFDLTRQPQRHGDTLSKYKKVNIPFGLIVLYILSSRYIGWYRTLSLPCDIPEQLQDWVHDSLQILQHIFSFFHSDFCWCTVHVLNDNWNHLVTQT